MKRERSQLGQRATKRRVDLNLPLPDGMIFHVVFIVFIGSAIAQTGMSLIYILATYSVSPLLEIKDFLVSFSNKPKHGLSGSAM